MCVAEMVTIISTAILTYAVTSCLTRCHVCSSMSARMSIFIFFRERLVTLMLLMQFLFYLFVGERVVVMMVMIILIIALVVDLEREVLL